MALRICSLVSGSSGNAFLAETEAGGVLVDAGLTVARLRALCAQVGADPGRIRGIVVTHDHSDHGRGAGVIHRATRAPLAMTAGTWSRLGPSAGKTLADPLLVRAGATLETAGMALHFVGTPHDGREPCAVVVEAAGRRCGLLTDLGHAFDGLGDLLATLDAVFLESNYSEPLLAANPHYPDFLKARIRGKHGHLENREAGALLRGHAGERLRTVVLSHLSKENNTPDRARAEVLAEAGAAFAGRGVRVAVAPRHAPSPFVVL